MFIHVTVGADDVTASRRFYDATLGAFGIRPGREDDRGSGEAPAPIRRSLPRALPDG
jgi:catechol 2,3-dioxygenase-like lactoylglutathione lyase family enzyme